MKKLLIALLILITPVFLLFISLIAIFSWYARNPPVRPDLPGILQKDSTQFKGLKRTWTIYKPASLKQKAPLIFFLPGSSQDAEILRLWSRYRMEELAEREGFLLVYAEAWEKGGKDTYEWNDCRKNTDLPAHNMNVNDVGYLVWLRSHLMQTYSLDPDRVFAMGVSDGGQMCYRLATEHPELFSSVAMMIAQQAEPENSNCNHPEGAVSILIMNGTEDPIIPFHGGEASFYGFASAGMVQSMEGTIAHWKGVNNITSEEHTEMLPDRDPDDGSRIRIRKWQGPRSKMVVYEVIGGGHMIPGGWNGLPPFILGNINHDINAMDVVVDFLLH